MRSQRNAGRLLSLGRCLEADPDSYRFYEIYSDAAALDTHREQPHYKKFIAATQDMMAERLIECLTLIKP